MISLVTLLACILASYLGYQLGFFRTTMLVTSALLGGMAAFNWGVPIARSLAPDASGAVSMTVLVGIFSAWGVLFFIAFRLAPMPLRMPWLLDELGGALAGALLGWIVFGVLLASARFSRDVDGWVRKTRGNENHAARSTPDGFWFSVLSTSSEGGLHRTPKRPFVADVELPPAPNG
jgi:hypothetical protein